MAGIALLLVAVVVTVLVLRPGATEVLDGPTPAPPSTNVCPDAVEDSAAPPPVAGDRVTSGQLSYPLLPAPFRTPGLDSRVPFGRNVRVQDAVVEADAAGTATWVASVLIAQLLAGDGFFGPEQGAKVVADCAVGKFYGDTPAGRQDQRNEAITVDGHPAWVIESHLAFDIPNIRTKGELMIIVVVDTGAESGLFYASIPDTSPQFVPPARAALTQLQVAN